MAFHNNCIDVAIQAKFFTLDRQQSKMLILLMKVDQKAFETEFSIAICHPTVKKSLETEFSFVICRPTCDKWQSRKLSSEF